MEELLGRVVALVHGMWKFRWQGLAVGWIAALVGVVAVFEWPNQYEATARIFVDTQSILKPLMSGLAVQPNIDQQVTMLSRTLISRPNVEKLVRMADLDLKKDSKKSRDALIEDLMKTLEIKSTARDNLYSLSFRDEDAERAKRVIQSLVSIFVESSLGASRKDTDTAKSFINEQIKSYEAKLEEAETRLKDFRLRNIELQTNDGQDSAARLSDLSAQLEQARLDLREAETARDAAKAQLTNWKSANAASAAPDLLQDSAIHVASPEIDARIEAQKRNLDTLLQRFTEEHPDIVSARRLIKDLEEQKRKELQEMRRTALASPQVAGSNENLAYQELNRMLASSEVQVAALRARVGEYASRYNQARAKMKTAPQIEAEAARLNRDYSITKKNYEDLVARRQSATMSGDLDVASGVADFRLIDPPRVAPQPVSPNRLLLLPIAMSTAIAAGLFTAFAGSQLRPVFYKVSELRGQIDLPVLGVVSMILRQDDTRRERADLLRFWVASGGLLLAFVAVLIATSLTRP
jgi:polysaccharide chain length determinant protein (PEP-CTERM system associated)